MIDFKAYFQIVQSSAQSMAKSMHKPSLNNKQSMIDYTQAIGASGKKASFIEEQQPNVIEWSV